MEALKTVNEPIQYIVIKLGDEQYGIDIRYIENIVRMQRITRVPKMPEYIKGVINLRGEVVPVMSLRLKMYLPEDELTKNSRIIIRSEEHTSELQSPTLVQIVCRLLLEKKKQLRYLDH